MKSPFISANTTNVTLLRRLLVGLSIVAATFLVNACSEPTEADETPQTLSESTERFTEQSKQAVNEQWLSGMVEGAYLFNTNLNNFSIDVDADGSTIILTGNVDSDSQSELAEQIALSINGVQQVDNQLSVGQTTDALAEQESSFEQTISDAAISSKVKAKLIANSETHGIAINVDTKDANVTLSGDVESATEKDLAYYLAKNTDGVNQVENKINVVEREKISSAESF